MGKVIIKLSQFSLAGTWLSLAIGPTILYFSPKILPLVIYVTMEHTELSWLTYLSMAGIIIILFSTTDYVVMCPLFTILSVCSSKYCLKKHFRISDILFENLQIVRTLTFFQFLNSIQQSNFMYVWWYVWMNEVYSFLLAQLLIECINVIT